MWELYDGYYLPLGECSPDGFRSLDRTGVDVYTLALAAPGNPYTVFMNTVCRVKSLLMHSLYPSRKRPPKADYRGRLEALFIALVDTGRNLSLPTSVGNDKHTSHVVLAYTVEPVSFFQSIVKAVLDNWDELGLEADGLFNIPDKLGIPRETWLAAWRACVTAMPDRLRTLVRDMPVRDYRKNMPPVDWYAFIGQWGPAGILDMRGPAGTAVIPAQEVPVDPQVITDHTLTDDILQEKRVMHNTNLAAKLEFILEFEADADVLAACIHLLPQKIGSIWASDLSVRCNALVANVALAKLGEGYPIAEALHFDALKKAAEDVDDLHRRVTMLIKTVDAVRGGVGLS